MMRIVLVFTLLLCLVRGQDIQVVLFPFETLVANTTHGFSIEVFEGVLSIMSSSYGYNINPTYHYTYSIQQFDKALRTYGDIGISGVSVTSSQQTLFRNSIAYRNSVIRAFTLLTTKQSSSISEIWVVFKNPRFLQYLLLMILLGIPSASLIWFFERKKNPQTYHRNYLLGVGAGYYWSWVTLSTVGYGDKAPKTIAGQTFTIIFIIIGIVLMNLLTGSISVIITVNSLTAPPTTLLDLASLNVSALRGSQALNIAQEVDANVKIVDSFQQGLDSLNNGTASTFLCEQASLLITNTTNTKFILSGPEFADVEYRFLSSFDSPLSSQFFTDMDFAIAEFKSSDNYTALLQTYFTSIFSVQQPHSTSLSDWIPVIVFLSVSVAYLIIITIIFCVKKETIPENIENQNQKQQGDSPQQKNEKKNNNNGGNPLN
eukprot:TRINITY_DN6921_c0_g2_i1.p1 TRINITY_DN6921_c0_g2~~TRINITY_DN6921_c0_g2_i1.p1  ORF type:complete len:430 (+),score=49.52 TRINITY_DN6921_c0_g2_i1:171-1460(+)